MSNRYIQFTFDDIRKGISGTGANTTLATLLSMQYDSGCDSRITSQIEPWIEGVIAKMKYNYDDTIGDVFRVDWRGIPFHEDDANLKMP